MRRDKDKADKRKRKSEGRHIEAVHKALSGQARKKKKARSHARKSRVDPPRSPYVAIMQPLVIVPDDPNAKVIIADAGSIVKMLDQHTLYRDRVSPITHRADERLVEYGKATAPSLGWISPQVPNLVKPVQGPTFLVTTSAEMGISAWDALRLKIARTRKTNPQCWLAPWMVLNGKKYPREVRETTRLFGGKPVKNEEFDVRCQRLFQLILHNEITMSTKTAKEAMAKKGKKSKKGKDTAKVLKQTKKDTAEKATKQSKKVKEDKPVKKAKDKTVAKKGKSGEFRANNRDHDDWIVKRLIKENPRREGTYKAKVWSLLKKGMTVKQFVEKGGGRTEIQRYIESGWVKLLRPSASE